MNPVDSSDKRANGYTKANCQKNWDELEGIEGFMIADG
jgi:hypothetical protein